LRGEIDARGGKKIIDVNEAMMELTLRIVSKALFSTGISAERITELGRTFTKLQQQIVKEVRQPLFNWWRVLSGKRKKTHELAEDTKSIMREIINARKKANVSSDDLLDMLLSTRYEDNNEPMSDQQLLDETIILFVAGHETTANTLAWTLYGTHDQHTVIDSIKENATELLSRKISMDEISTKGYLDQVLQESMRMYPPAWILDRVALEDDSFGDVKINKGDMIGIYVYGVHHNEEYWQDDLTFDPERFANGKSSVHPYAFIPFGGGPRLCIGHHFAMIEMKLAIAELMHQFEWTLQPGQQVDFVPLITLRPRNNIWMEVKCRQLD
jgi:cytochrome P450